MGIKYLFLARLPLFTSLSCHPWGLGVLGQGPWLQFPHLLNELMPIGQWRNLG